MIITGSIDIALQALVDEMESILMRLVESRRAPGSVRTSECNKTQEQDIHASRPAVLQLSSISLALIGGAGAAISPLFSRIPSQSCRTQERESGGRSVTSRPWERSTSLFSDESDEELPGKSRLVVCIISAMIFTAIR